MHKLLAMLMLCWVAAASAEPRRDADEHARRGIALYNLGKYEEAIDEFEQAYTLFQSDALLFNLAQAHRQLQHCDRALSYYERFLEGDPTPALAAQVESLLPKLQTACRAKLEPPAGPVGPGAPADPVVPAAPPRGAALPPGTLARVSSADREPRVASETVPPPTTENPALSVTAALSAGVIVAGQMAPTTAARAMVGAPVAWLRGGQLGGAAAVERLWRGDDRHDATLVEVMAVLQYHSVLDGGRGRITAAGGIGALHFGSLDHSDGVVPGLTTTGLWAPVSRGELGFEHAIARELALRVAAGIGWIPRTGAMLSSATEFEVVAGVRYER